jgi:hypothetical protein
MKIKTSPPEPDFHSGMITRTSHVIWRAIVAYQDVLAGTDKSRTAGQFVHRSSVWGLRSSWMLGSRNYHTPSLFVSLSTLRIALRESEIQMMNKIGPDHFVGVRLIPQLPFSSHAKLIICTEIVWMRALQSHSLARRRRLRQKGRRDSFSQTSSSSREDKSALWARPAHAQTRE